MTHEIETFESFRGLSEGGRELLAHGTLEKRFARGTAIVHKGQAVSGAYVVLEGRLRVFTVSPNGTEATLYFLGPGETCVLALNCLFNDLLYPGWVEAESGTRLAIVQGATWRRLFETEAAIQGLTVKTLSTLVWRLMGELEQVHAGTLRQRLAQFILTHAAADGALRMTQQQLAHHLGTIREGVARLVGEFAAAGLVQARRGQLLISDLPGLRRVVAPDPARSAGRARA